MNECRSCRSCLAAPTFRVELRSLVLAAVCCCAACADDDDDDGLGDNAEVELVTRVTLTFTPETGEPVVASFSDPDGLGGDPGQVDPIVLALGATYRLTVSSFNELEEPAVEVTDEIAMEAEEHLVLFFGDAVEGPASYGNDPLLEHMYDDLESDYVANEYGEDLPVGLTNVIVPLRAGSGELEARQLHLPDINGTPVKVPGLEGQFADGEPMPGELDWDLDFPLEVQG